MKFLVGVCSLWVRRNKIGALSKMGTWVQNELYLQQTRHEAQSKMTYILVDTQNMFFRARHVARQWQLVLMKEIGLAFHIMFNSVKKASQYVCMEATWYSVWKVRSWRKDVYEPYKKES